MYININGSVIKLNSYINHNATFLSDIENYLSHMVFITNLCGK